MKALMTRNYHLSTKRRLKQQVQKNMRSAVSANTLRGYNSDWEQFTVWCQRNGYPSLPSTPETVAAYISDLAEMKRRITTIHRHLCSISFAHQTAKLDSPTWDTSVRLCWAGIRKNYGTPRSKKTPLLIEEIYRIIPLLPRDLRGIRDKALLLVGFTGAFRRSELTALNWEDISIRDRGAIVTLRRSKTDQEGQGRNVPLPARPDELCPVTALLEWQLQSGNETGAIFGVYIKEAK